MKTDEEESRRQSSEAWLLKARPHQWASAQHKSVCKAVA